MDDVQGYSLLQGETELYMGFFKRRLELENEYAEGLKRLSARTNELDRRFDEEDKQPTPTSWRKAWLSVRESVVEQMQIHQAFAKRTDHILQTLTTMRDNKDRMRRRIKDDVRNTITEHTDYKQAVARLRKAYEKKVDDVREHEESEREQSEGGGAGSWPPEHWTTGGGGSDNEKERRDSTASARGEAPLSIGSGGSTSTTPLASPPVLPPQSQPVFISGATSLSAKPGNDYRDPPASAKPNVFDAIAKRDWSGEKSRVNSIVRAVGNLAKGEAGKEQGTGHHGGLKPSNVKGVKARQVGAKLKREAEQADRDYRNGIFRLETLALNRERVKASASGSLHEFAEELSATLKDVFLQHVGDLVTLGRSESDLGEKLRPSIELIEPKGDAAGFTKRLREQAPPEPPVYYVNAFVGECRSLLFGVSLTDYHAKHTSRLVPLIVQKCISTIEALGLDSEGIYRIPGKLATVQKIVHQFEKDEEAFTFDPKEEPSTIAGVLKLYLRQLPFPLFQYSTPDRLAFSNDFHNDPEGHLSTLARRLRRLALPHQATLKMLCEHLARVVEMQSVNKMTAVNLGLVFGPVVFGEDEGATLESAMHSAKDVVLELLIIHHATLFQGLPAEPPAVARSRAGSGTHSAPTAEMPPPPLPRRPQQEALMQTEPSQMVHSEQDRQHARLAGAAATDSTTLQTPVPAAVPENVSSDSLFNLYQSASAFESHQTPPVTNSARFGGDLSSPSPPLSAAGGRRIHSGHSSSRNSSADFSSSTSFEAPPTRQASQ